MKLTADTKGTCDARRYVLELMRAATGGNTFDDYISKELAGDFVWNLANHLLAAPTPSDKQEAMSDEHAETLYRLARMVGASDWTKELRKSIATLSKESDKQEAVAEVVPHFTPSGKIVALNTKYQDLPVGTKLYAAPLTHSAEQDRIDEKNTLLDNREACSSCGLTMGESILLNKIKGASK